MERLDLGGGHELVIDGDLLLHDGQAVTARELTRRYPAAGRVWAWLRERGVRRVSSGRGGQLRHRRARMLSLSPEHSERIDALADRLDCTASAVVERAIDELSRVLADTQKDRPSR